MTQFLIVISRIASSKSSDQKIGKIFSKLVAFSQYLNYNMLDWKILTNLKIYLNLILYLGGQKTINNTFCTVCIERRYVLLYNISNLWPKPLLQHYLALNYIPIVSLAIAFDTAVNIRMNSVHLHIPV